MLILVIWENGDSERNSNKRLARIDKILKVFCIYRAYYTLLKKHMIYKNPRNINLKPKM